MSVNDITTSSTGIVQKQIVNIVIFSVFYIKSSSQTQGKEFVFHIIYLFKKKEKRKKNNLPGWDSNCEPFTLWKTVEPIGLWQLVYKVCKICTLIYIASVVCLRLDIEWKINLFGRILRLFFIFYLIFVYNEVIPSLNPIIQT